MIIAAQIIRDVYFYKNLKLFRDDFRSYQNISEINSTFFPHKDIITYYMLNAFKVFDHILIVNVEISLQWLDFSWP